MAIIHRGTIFQRKVWRALSEIPFGQVISYQELAYRVGHPKAVRAVATAVAKNPQPIVVPCHRVVRANGAIGEYSFWGGTRSKIFLLWFERNVLVLLKLCSLLKLFRPSKRL